LIIDISFSVGRVSDLRRSVDGGEIVGREDEGRLSSRRELSSGSL
jgi:hypothetical protein